MKTSSILKTINLVALMAAGATLWAAEDTVTYTTKPGPDNLVFIEGTSTVHDWRVEGKIIGGKFLAGADFPLTKEAAKPGPVTAKADIFIPVRSLKSVKDGKPYSNSMDDIMYEKLLEKTSKLIKYSLKEFTFQEVRESGGPVLLFEAKGDLTVAGVTKPITMPVEMRVDTEGKQLRFTGGLSSMMSDFKIETPVALGGTIKTGNDVKLGFAWAVRTK